MPDQRRRHLSLLPDTVKDLTPKMVEDLDELFGGHRPFVTTEDGVSHVGRVGVTDWDYENSKWHVKVTDWNDVVVYDGPAPVPPGLAELSIDELSDGRSYLFEMTPVE